MFEEIRIDITVSLTFLCLSVKRSILIFYWNSQQKVTYDYLLMCHQICRKGNKFREKNASESLIKTKLTMRFLIAIRILNIKLFQLTLSGQRLKLKDKTVWRSGYSL